MKTPFIAAFLALSTCSVACEYTTAFDYVDDHHTIVTGAGSGELDIAEGTAAEIVIYQWKEGPSYRAVSDARSSNEAVLRIVPTGHTAPIPDSSDSAPTFIVYAIAPGKATLVLTEGGQSIAGVDVEVAPQER